MWSWNGNESSLRLRLPRDELSLGFFMRSGLERKVFVEWCGGELDEELTEAVDDDFGDAMAFFGRRFVWIAGAAIGGKQVPGTRDADPAAVDGFEASGLCRALVGGEGAIWIFGNEIGEVGEHEGGF